MPTTPLSKYLVFIVGCCLTITPVFAQQRITGQVTTNGGAPLAGATVLLVGSTSAVTTIADGSFTISADSGSTLEVSYIGYKPKRVKIGNGASLKISLSESAVNLEEVVVTGYTAQRVKEITGSVDVIKPKDLVSIPAGQVEQMLQGRAAGLNVISSGEPGGSSNVRLHGVGNFGDVTPLYIIDGVQGNINNLNPHDIESIQLLKDAGAYAIYGVRGANGVFVITTRSGKPGKTKISYDSYMGITLPVNGPDLLNSQEMADLTWLAYKNSGQPPGNTFYGFGSKPVLPDYFIAGTNIGLAANDPRANPDLYNIDFSKDSIYQIVESNKAGTDWMGEFFQPAFRHEHSLSISGANEKNKYLFSLGYLNQQGTALNTYLKRFTTRVNTVFAVNDHIRVGENLQWTYRDNPRKIRYGGVDNDIFRAITTQPILPVYDIKGGWAHMNPKQFWDNPVAMQTIAKDDKSNSWEISGNAFGEIDFLRSFTVRSSFGGSLVNYYSYNFFYLSYDSLNNGLPDNALTESSGYRRSWTWTNTLKFSNTIKNNHHINALIGTEAIDNYNREVGGKKIGLFTNNSSYRFLTNGALPSDPPTYSFAGESSLFSLFAQADYDFKKKYFFRATVRRDGSSVFGPDNRYGWFPSFSAAWRISDENFISNLEWLNELKLRASWGKTGFYGNTDPYNQHTLYGGSIGDAYYDINGTNSPVQGFRAVRLGDPNTGWQEDQVINIGFESIYFNNKLSVTVDWYNKKAKGLLFPLMLPDILGGATPPNVNVGIVQNKGVDISIGSKGRWSPDWSWDALATISIYKNKIIQLNNLNYFTPSYPGIRNQVGYPVSSFYGFKILGIFKDSAEVAKAPTQAEANPGRYRYQDTNNDNQINDDDRTFLGNANPDFTTGINLSIRYKNFDLTAFFYGSFGNEVQNATRFYTDFYLGGGHAKRKALLYDSWTPQNTSASLPIAELNNTFSTGAFNSFNVEDGSYFRNKSLIFGYTFSRSQLQRLKLEKLRVYLQALNLFTITNYTGLDPELSGTSAAFGIDFGNYPNNERQFLLGISLNF